MSYHKAGNRNLLVINWPLMVCVLAAIYLAASAFYSGLTSCGGLYLETQIIGVSMIVAVIISFVSCLIINRDSSWGRRLFYGFLLSIFMLSISAVFSAGGWVYYLQPQSIDAATQEFWKALHGERCG